MPIDMLVKVSTKVTAGVLQNIVNALNGMSGEPPQAAPQPIHIHIEHYHYSVEPEAPATKTNWLPGRRASKQ